MKGGKPGPLWPWAKQFYWSHLSWVTCSQRRETIEVLLTIGSGFAFVIVPKWVQYTGAMQKPKQSIFLFLSPGNPNISFYISDWVKSNLINFQLPKVYYMLLCYIKINIEPIITFFSLLLVTVWLSTITLAHQLGIGLSASKNSFN